MSTSYHVLATALFGRHSEDEETTQDVSGATAAAPAPLHPPAAERRERNVEVRHARPGGRKSLSEDAATFRAIPRLQHASDALQLCVTHWPPKVCAADQQAGKRSADHQTLGKAITNLCR